MKRLLYVAAILAATPAAAEPAKLDGAALRELLSGKTLTRTNARNVQLRENYRADGTVQTDWFDRNSGRSGQNRGIWQVRDDTLCVAKPEVENNRLVCAHLLKDGAKYWIDFAPAGMSGRTELTIG